MLVDGGQHATVMPMGSIQIKNAPDELHDRVRARAAERSMTVRDYVLDALRRDLARPTLDAWLDRVHAAGPADLDPGEAADAVQAGRDERDAQLVPRPGQ